MGESAELLGPDGPLASQLPGYELRQGQLDMAQLVEDTLRHSGIALCEAGTGTGKTLAYLAPAVLSGKRVVVSTGTRTLQDQIMQHDLPLLRDLGRLPVQAACMKGLSNYLCKRRYAAFMASAGAVSPKIARQLPLLESFAQTTDTGDRADVRGHTDNGWDALFREVQSSPETRIGPRCTFYDECHVTQMKQRAAQASVVVVNHHLLFADLALKGAHGAGVIPEYDALIIDEAHLLEDIAAEFFGATLSATRFDGLLRDVERALQSALESDSEAKHNRRAIDHVCSCVHAVHCALLPHLGHGGGVVALEPGLINGHLRGPLLALDDGLYALSAVCRQGAADSQSLAQLARRIERLRDDLAHFIDVQGGDRVLWAKEVSGRFELGCSPVDVGEPLREHLYQRAHATIFTSATLSTSGHFDFIKRRLGIDFEVDTLSVPSPFDYERMAALYLPKDMPDYRAPGFETALAAQVVALVGVTGGGAFVLCTSLRMMRALRNRCHATLSAPTLMQGEAPNAALLAEFRSAGNAVLFATMSFFQGVDVPGSALRLVIIDKLPFEVPTDPRVQARCDQLRSEGDNPFMKYVVPAAALTLKQGFGRLIRKATDRGVVAIVDPRLTTKGYGKVFLRSLPPARRCHDLQQVEAFWSGEPSAD